MHGIRDIRGCTVAEGPLPRLNADSARIVGLIVELHRIEARWIRRLCEKVRLRRRGRLQEEDRRSRIIAQNLDVVRCSRDRGERCRVVIAAAPDELKVVQRTALIDGEPVEGLALHASRNGARLTRGERVPDRSRLVIAVYRLAVLASRRREARGIAVGHAGDNARIGEVVVAASAGRRGRGRRGRWYGIALQMEGDEVSFTG